MPRVTAKEKILDAALRLFQQDGYVSTSVDEIIADAGVSKGSFYHAFKSKEILGLETIEHYTKHVMETLQRGSFLAVEDPVQRVLAYLKHIEKKASELWCDGCMMGNFTTDMARHHPAVRDRLKRHFISMEEQLIQLLDPMVARLNCQGITGRQLARQFISTMQGAILLGQAHKDISVTQDCICSFRAMLETMASHQLECNASVETSAA